MTQKTQLNQAQKYLTEIEAILQEAERANSEIKKKLTEYKGKDRSIKSTIGSANRTATAASKSISQLRKQRDKIKRILTSIERYQKFKFDKIVSKIEDPDNGFKAKIDLTNKSFIETERIKTKVSSNYREVNDILKRLKNDAKSLRNLERTIISHSEVIVDNKEVTEKSRADILALESESKKIADNINNCFNNAEKQLSLIESYEAESKAKLSNIKSINDDSENFLDEIKKIYEIASNTGLGGQFDEKRKIHELDLKYWSDRVLYVTIALFISVISLFFLHLWLMNWDLNKINFDLQYFARFLLVTPIIYYLIFVSNRYYRTKTLLEKYTFKTTLAFSIQSHIELMEDSYLSQIGNKDELIKLIIRGFDKIYDNHIR